MSVFSGACRLEHTEQPAPAEVPAVKATRPKKADLIAEAKAKGITVPKGATVADLIALLGKE